MFGKKNIYISVIWNFYIQKVNRIYEISEIFNVLFIFFFNFQKSVN
jgi:hypothetical protein